MAVLPTSRALQELIDALRLLPGVGVKSAQRMAFHLMQNDRSAAQRLSLALGSAVEQVKHCERCHTFSDSPWCVICADTDRDASLLCVVENPSDQAALERTGSFKGYYYVLMGAISPLDGVGPQAIGLAGLIRRAGEADVKEVIVATNFTAEGEATSYAISEMLKTSGVKVTRLARGVPVGSELEYVDLGTIAHALSDRR